MKKWIKRLFRKSGNVYCLYDASPEQVEKFVSILKKAKANKEDIVMCGKVSIVKIK